MIQRSYKQNIMPSYENFLFGVILNTFKSLALSEPELAGWLRYGMTHKNTPRRMTKGMTLSSNIIIDMSYVIHPKYILSEPFY